MQAQGWSQGKAATGRLLSCIAQFANITSFVICVYSACIDPRSVAVAVWQYACDCVLLLVVVCDWLLARRVEAKVGPYMPAQPLKKRYMAWLLGVSLLPLEILGFLSRNFRLVSPLASNLRLNRSIRLIPALAFLRQNSTSIAGHGAKALMLEAVIIFSMVIHAMSCLWFSLAATPYPLTWIATYRELAQNNNAPSTYTLAAYWTVAALTTTEFTNVLPTTVLEKWVTITFMVFCLLLWGYSFGNVTSYKSNTQQGAYRRGRIATLLRSHLTAHDVDATMTEKVLLQLNPQQGHHDYDFAASSMNLLPSNLVSEVRIQTLGRVMEAIPSFSACPIDAWRALTEHLEVRHFVPGEVFLHRGQLPGEIGVIMGGVACALDGDAHVLGTLCEGDVYGEVGTLLELRAAVELRAQTHCDVVVLPRISLKKVLCDHPGVWEAMQNILEARVKAAEEITQYERDLAASPETGNGAEQQPPPFNVAKGTSSISLFIADTGAQDLEDSVITSDTRGFAIRVLSFLSRRDVRTVDALIVVMVAMYIATFTGDSATTWIVASVLDIPCLIKLIQAFRYLKKHPTSMLVPLTCMPWGVIPFCYGMYRIAALVHLLHLLRLAHVVSGLRSYKSFNVAKVQLLWLSVIMLLAVHTMACVGFVLACTPHNNGTFECAPTSWAAHYGVERLDSFRQYVATLYWIVNCITNTGYGDITVYTDDDRVFSLLVMIIGKVSVGFLIATWGAATANQDSAQVAYHEMMEETRQFLMEHKVEPALCISATDHLEWRWVNDEGSTPWHEYSILPENIRNTLLPKLSMPILGTCPLFKDLSAVNASFLSTRFRSFLSLRGSTIIHAGDLAREMYFLESGFVELRTPEGRAFLRLGPGAYFGDLDMIFNRRRHCSAFALTDCRLLTLTTNDVSEVVATSSTFANKLKLLTEKADVLDAVIEVMQSLEALPPIHGDRSLRRSRIPFAQYTIVRKGARSPAIKRSGSSAARKKTNIETLGSKTSKGSGTSGSTGSSRRQNSMPSSAKSRVNESGVLARHGWRFWGPLLEAVLIVIQSFITLYTCAFSSLANPAGTVLFYTVEVALVPLSFLTLRLPRWEPSTGALIRNRLHVQAAALVAGGWRAVVAAFPMDLVLLISLPVSSRYSLLGRLNRLLRLPSVWQKFGKLERRAELKTTSIRILKYLIFSALIIFIVMFGWSFLTSFDSCSSGVCGLDAAVRDDSAGFMAALYWAIATLLTLGSPGINAQNAAEQCYTILCILLGVLGMGYFTASVMGALTNAHRKRIRYLEKVSSVANLLRRLGVAPSAIDRLMKLYRYLWRRNRGADFSACIAILPPALQTELAHGIYSEALESVPLFAGKDMSFRRVLSTAMKPLDMLEGEYIVRKNAEGDEMFFIYKGTVEVVSEDGKTVFATMKDGAFFGEIALVFRCPRTASIRTATVCNLFVLNQKDFTDVLAAFPEVAEEIRAEANERFQLVKKREAAKAATTITATTPPASSTVSHAPSTAPTPMTSSAIAQPTASDAPVVTAGAAAPTPMINPGSAVPVNASAPPTAGSTVSGSPEGPTTLHSRWLAIIKQFGRSSWWPSRLSSSYRFTLLNAVAYVTVFLAIFDASFARESLSLCGATFGIDLFYFVVGLPYFSRRDVMEICGLLPWDAFALAVHRDSSAAAVFATFRLVRLWRLRRIWNAFSKWEAASGDNLLRVQACKLVIFSVLLVHGLGSCWHLALCTPSGLCSDGPWSHSTIIDNGERYTSSIYMTIATATMTGGGKIILHSIIGRLMAVAVMSAGFFLSTYVLAMIGATLTNNTHALVEYRHKYQDVLQSITSWQIAPALKEIVAHHLEHRWQHNHGRLEHDILSDIPDPMRTEILVSLWRCAVRDLLGPTVSQGGIDATVRALRVSSALQGDIVIRQDTLVSELILVHKGVITQRRPVGPDDDCTFTEGTWIRFSQSGGRLVAPSDYIVTSEEAILVVLNQSLLMNAVDRQSVIGRTFPWALKVLHPTTSQASAT